MKTYKMIIITFVLCTAFFIAGNITTQTLINLRNKELDNSVIYKVRIDVEKINLRKKIGLDTDIIKEVYKDEIFDVVEYYEGNQYNWYKIVYGNHQTGWIASSKVSSWVKVESECK